MISNLEFYSGGKSLANHKSAAKRARQAKRRNSVNSSRKNSVRTSEKALLKALTEKKLQDIPALLKGYMSQMSKAAQRGVFKKETASRKISRLSTKATALLNSKN